MAPYPKITTYPPLGQLTIIKPEQETIHFTLLIEWNLARPAYPFETRLAYNTASTSPQHESQWPQIPLTKPSHGEGRTPYMLNVEDCRQAVYTGVLSRSKFAACVPSSSSIEKKKEATHVLFTVLFRVDAHAPWQWVSILDGTAPGELVLQSHIDLSSPEFVFKNVVLTDQWTVKSFPTQSIGNDNSSSSSSSSSSNSSSTTRTYLLESKSPIPRTIHSDPDANTDLATLPLGTIPSAVRYFSVVRLEPYWLGPRQGKGSFFHTSEDAVAVSCLLGDCGLVVTFVVVGWCDDVYQVLRGDGAGGIVVAARDDNVDEDGNGNAQRKNYRVVVSAGLDVHCTMAAAMDQVREIVASFAQSTTTITTAATTSNSSLAPERTRESSSSPSSINNSDDTAPQTSTEESVSESNTRWLDSLSFCTWNALGQNLTQEALLSALSQLQAHDIHVSTLLIDDNWQTLGPIPGHDYSDSFFRGWADMQANTAVAPTGLKDLITSIRAQHPYLRDIGVWHALMGYWGGLAPSGSITRNYKTTNVPALLMGNVPADITSIATGDLHRFYDDFYAFLADAGLTFVKTDVQHMLSTFRSAQSRRDLIASYQSAWTAAHVKHFGGKAISCMSQTPQTLFHSLLMKQTNTPPVVHRNSDDFYPEVAASHPWHVWVNAHNAVFTRHLNAVLDWDMFQTDHEFSAYHAAARCVSGGPILITDTPGMHDEKLIAQMTARSPGGASIALRTEPGAVLDVFGLYTEGNVLKVKSGTKCGGVIVALFNIAGKEARGLISIDEFGLHGKEEEVLLRSHRSERTFGPIMLSASTGGQTSRDDEETGKLVHTRLDVRGWEILTAQLVKTVQVDSNKHIKVCVLGLLGKMSGAAAITASSVSVEDGRLNIAVGLRALGRLGVWFDRADVKGRVHVSVGGAKVNEQFLKLVTLPESHRESGDRDDHTDNGKKSPNGTKDRADEPMSDLSMVPHVWEVDVEAFWNHNKMWDDGLKDVSVEILVG